LVISATRQRWLVTSPGPSHAVRIGDREIADGVLGLNRTEIGGEPLVQPRCTVPFEAVEIIAHGMERAFTRALVDGLMDGVLAETAEACPLQIFLDGDVIGVVHWSRLERWVVREQRFH
jgi:hypothetical protein